MFLDTSAWIEYFLGSREGERVRLMLSLEPIVYTCPMVLAELTSKYTRTLGAEAARARVEHVQQQTALIEHSAALGTEAGKIHAEMKTKMADFGMADAFILASARSRGIKVLSKDPHLHGVPDGIEL